MNDEINKPSAFTFDEERLQRAVPFRLEKTTMPGVFTIPAPPAGFDPRTARPSELIQAGFPWKRPDAQSNPVARALWDRVMAREWRRAEAVPAVPIVGRRRRLHPPGPTSEGPNIDSNWAGAVLTTGTWDGVVAAWQVPHISKPSEAAVNDEGFLGWEMSSWVGLGGYLPNNSNNLLQGGVVQQLLANGKWGCFAFYEWWIAGNSAANGDPQYTYQSVQIGGAGYVNPGDSVFCSAQYQLDENGHPVGALFGWRMKQAASMLRRPCYPCLTALSSAAARRNGSLRHRMAANGGRGDREVHCPRSRRWSSAQAPVGRRAFSARRPMRWAASSRTSRRRQRAASH